MIVPDIDKNIYPFRGMKLSRADIEWLLATHDNGRGPVDWNDERRWERQGLDLRGADLRGVNLRSLPLTRLQGGLNQADRRLAMRVGEQREVAAIHLEGADLTRAHLEGSDLHSAHVEAANFHRAHLEDCHLCNAHLDHTRFDWVHLENTDLNETHLETANLMHAYLGHADLREAHLEGTLLNGAFFDPMTDLRGASLGKAKKGFAFLSEVHWNGVHLSVIDWKPMTMLGEEDTAQRSSANDGTRKPRQKRLAEYMVAVRANRQLAVELQNQGLNEQAARFAYRAQVLQRKVCWFEMIQQGVTLRQRTQALGAWLFSWFLFVLTGYGYVLWHSFLSYVLTISCFMSLYHLLDPHLAWHEALVVSMTAFHGRGFSPSTFTPGDPLSFASAAEAFAGLIIEVTLIATLTQRFFHK